MITWITDANGNRCSVEYWGSDEKAREALATLKDCSRCSDCSDCSGCSYCSRCSRCSGCSYCSYCSYCSDCSDCSYCSGCSDFSRCSGCSDRSGKNDADAPEPLVPAIPNIHETIYAAVSQPGALEMGSWHTCERTHCRAGWAVTLAGAEGKALEAFHNTELAAMLIYKASGYEISPVRFHESNDAALADMRRLAQGGGGLMDDIDTFLDAQPETEAVVFGSHYVHILCAMRVMALEAAECIP